MEWQRPVRIMGGHDVFGARLGGRRRSQNAEAVAADAVRVKGWFSCDTLTEMRCERPDDQTVETLLGDCEAGWSVVTPKWKTVLWPCIDDRAATTSFFVDESRRYVPCRGAHYPGRSEKIVVCEQKLVHGRLAACTLATWR